MDERPGGPGSGAVLLVLVANFTGSFSSFLAQPINPDTRLAVDIAIRGTTRPETISLLDLRTAAEDLFSIRPTIPCPATLHPGLQNTYFPSFTRTLASFHDPGHMLGGERG